MLILFIVLGILVVFAAFFFGPVGWIVLSGILIGVLLNINSNLQELRTMLEHKNRSHVRKEILEYNRSKLRSLGSSGRYPHGREQQERE